jgi:hypothetical protein
MHAERMPDDASVMPPGAKTVAAVDIARGA